MQKRPVHTKSKSNRRFQAAVDSANKRRSRQRRQRLGASGDLLSVNEQIYITSPCDSRQPYNEPKPSQDLLIDRLTACEIIERRTDWVFTPSRQFNCCNRRPDHREIFFTQISSPHPSITIRLNAYATVHLFCSKLILQLSTNKSMFHRGTGLQTKETVLTTTRD